MSQLPFPGRFGQPRRHMVALCRLGHAASAVVMLTLARSVTYGSPEECQPKNGLHRHQPQA